MKIELIGALDYAKLEQALKDKKVESVDEILEYMKGLEKAARVEKVAAAGRLSRFPGNVFEILGLTGEETYEQNIKFVERVTSKGHDSVADHDYLVFAVKDVSPVVEQTIIEERFASFTVKSRREVDFSTVGFYTPDFHDENGNVIPNNSEIQEEYKKYMNHLFDVYSELLSIGLKKEDARYILPYCYNSNLIMGIDAHTLREMIIKYTKTHLSKIQEIREFGERLREIAEQYVPYIIREIDKVPLVDVDQVRKCIDENVRDHRYYTLDRVKLLSSSSDIDNSILISALMGRYQYSKAIAQKILNSAVSKNPNFKKELMRTIAFKSDKRELAQVSFQFQIPVSFVVLTHASRHRTVDFAIPDFSPIVDLSQYMIPPEARKQCPGKIEGIFDMNIDMYNHFKRDYGIRDEDLIYFTLSGNMVNVLASMDGKTVAHILALRECGTAQWETQDMANGIHSAIAKLEGAELFSSILGPTCITQGFCKEGERSCGRIIQLQEKKKNETSN